MKTSASDVSLVLFDLDGTLFRPTEILVDAYRTGIERYRDHSGESVAIPDRETILSQIGHSVEEIRQTLFPDLSRSGFLQLQELIECQLLEHIRQGRGELVEGAPELLENLRQSFQLGLITNAGRAYMETVVDSRGLDSYFMRMRCREDVSGDHKGILVKSMVEDFEVKPEAVLVVGDRSSDRHAALSVGAQFLGCNYGYGDAEEFAEDLRISQISQILQYPPVRRVYMTRQIKPSD